MDNKMNFNVPTNWDNRLIEELTGYPVYSFYGMLNHGVIGGGRPSRAIPLIAKKEAQKHIEKIRLAGFRFNYVLNAPCMGNLEYDPKVRKEILEYVKWIYDSGANSVTISIPLLVDLVKRHFPKLEVVGSVFSGIDTVQMVKHLLKRGVKHMVVEQVLNRNIPVLKRLASIPEVKLQIIVNNSCLFSCPFRKYHANINAHASQSQTRENTVKADYPVLNCSITRLESPVEFIKSPWVRPEDLKYYEDIGITTFKISGRTKSTDWIVKVTKAYSERQYNGNLADILSFPYDEGALSFDPPLSPPSVYIDNSKLDGFFNFFLKNECRLLSCEQCSHCETYANAALLLKKEEVSLALERYNSVLSRFIDTGLV